jgi:hypothetical protein
MCLLLYIFLLLLEDNLLADNLLAVVEYMTSYLIRE